MTIRTMPRSSRYLKAQAKKIRMILLDVDGVLTDGSIVLDNRGNEWKAFHVRDGHGIKMALRAGIIIGLITGRTSGVVTRRARELGIREVHQGIRDKIVVYESILRKYSLDNDAVAYIGDDIVDGDIFDRAGLAVSVADGDPSIRNRVHLITRSAGGRGAVREFIDFVLFQQGKLHAP